MNLDNINTKIYILKTFIASIFTLLIYFKILNIKVKKVEQIIMIGYVAIISIICFFIKYGSNSYIGTIFLIFLLSLITANTFKKKIGSTVVFLIISYGINYIFFFISMVTVYILNKVILIRSDLINMIIMGEIELIIFLFFTKIKRLKNGFSFISNKFIYTELFDLMILNGSLIIIFCSLVFSINNVIASGNIFICFIIFSFIIIEIISKSIQLYYKQKLLIQEVNKSKIDLKNKQEEIQKLESENLNSNKKIHSLVHKQKVLEYKVDKLLKNEQNDANNEIKKDLEKISNDLFQNNNTVELNKTGIREIDDILEYMQYECQKNNIEFNLLINENIFQMVNNFISKKELEILLADHIKDAIIAINHSNNINRSILVKIGYFEDCYSIYIYDSGIEFSEDIIEKLGKVPVTTYKEEGGSGIGFMNTFETLNKTKGSLIIKKIGQPCADNYTKIIIIKFDGKNEFKYI